MSYTFNSVYNMDVLLYYCFIFAPWGMWDDMHACAFKHKFLMSCLILLSWCHVDVHIAPCNYLLLYTELNWIAITLAMIGKLGITISFGLVYVVTAEVYPTTVRTVGVGASSFWARVGGAIAPLVAQLVSSYLMWLNVCIDIYISSYWFES